jgi:GNAT superfamily N-acetyltransferase
MDAHQYGIYMLNKNHEKREFSCGIEPLDRYIKEQAGQDECRHIAATYVLTEINSRLIMGYYTLSASSIELSALPEVIRKKLPRYPTVPAALLGRLAVDQQYQGQNLGEYLLIDALKRGLDISHKMAAMAVVVHAKNDQAIRFYVRYGFIPFVDAPNRLFLPMDTIEQLWKN